MKRSAKGFVAAGVLALVGVAGMATHASAFVLRVPQVSVLTGRLQNYFTAQGQGINVNTDQIDAQVWSMAFSGNPVFTLMIEYAGYANSNAVGVYNADEFAPSLFEVFPGTASPGSHAMISFLANGTLAVTRFDENSLVIGQTIYPNVHRNSFGFYLQGPGGLFYSQDGRNPGATARMVAYQGSGSSFGEWWLCFEDLPVGGSDQDFEDAVVILESVIPLKAQASTLGAVKAMYR